MSMETLSGTAAGGQAGHHPGQEARFSPSELAAILGESTRPTEEQAAIISSGLTPRLVIAGAGSGKTATMADRVVWLVANGWVRPEEVLGVTFTRKAAGELASRIRSKLARLQRIAAADTLGMGFPEEMLDADALEPRVSTYHSYASGIVSDYGLRLGIERDVVLLGAAQAWQLASEVVEGYDGEYEHFTAAKSTLVNAVIQLAGECSEHLQDPAGVRGWLLDRAGIFEQLPYVAGAAKNPTQAAGALAGMLRTRASVADMVVRYQEVKRARGVLDFGDLVALAAHIASDIPLAAATERARCRVVLLDEFQDTSHAQLVLFSRLFGGGHAVTAVGDPNQSIYGFRGASAGQLFHFVEEFPVRHATDDPGVDSWTVAPTSYLTTAWRNGRNILAAANTVAAPLNQAAASGGPAGERTAGGSIPVPALQPSPVAVDGSVVLGRFATDEDEAASIARDVRRYERTVFEEEPDGMPVRPAMAVLCRRRAQMDCLRREFEIQGIPYEIVGLGGLLDTPEVVDLVSTLRVLADPGRSDALMRLLAGARWRIGPADLMAFGDWARFLARNRGVPGAGGTDADEPLTDVVLESDITDAASLVEGLDFLPRPGWTSGHGRTLSETALDRLGRLSGELRTLRGSMDDDLSTLLGEVERSMLLDIEVAARPGMSIHQARRNLDAFQDAAAGFLQTSQRIDLLAFLGWLEAAASEEGGLDMAAVEPNREAVQLLTVHASKGLEWDVVFVPGLNDGSFPSNRDSRWSTGAAALPWPLRGDREDLPQWDLEQPDQKGWLDAEKDFKAEVQHHGEIEERRLAYVAYTRAKFVLSVSSAAWNGSRAGIADMSSFLAGLAPLAGIVAAGGLGSSAVPGSMPDSVPGFMPAGGTASIHAESLAEDALPEENPLTSELELAVFPYDPLEGPHDPRTGERRRLVPGRRAVMDAAAALVLGEMSRQASGGDGAGAFEDESHARNPLPGGSSCGSQLLRGIAARWAEEARLLLERRNRRQTGQDVHLPAHISASMFVELGEDPAAVLARLRRPVPREPGISARKGTAFHAWVEEYFGTAGMLDLDEAPGSDAHIDAAYGLETMVDTFKQSAWAHRAPAFVEVPVETRIGSVVVRGRIDAVFQDADGRWELVDWKTGRRPSGRQLETKSVQLAVYRLAWARLKGVALEEVSAAFYYVADDAVVRPHDLGTAAELEAIIGAALHS